MNIKQLQLCLVTDIQEKPLHIYLQFLQQAIDGGVTSIQLRDKQKTPDEFRRTAYVLKTYLTPLQIPLMINDHIDIAKEIDADGVHLGQSDISPQEARMMLGANKIIGLSMESLGELAFANTLTCIDYIAASAVFPSKTKLNCKKIWGLAGLKEITKISKYPVIAIGGINTNNIKSVYEHGASGVAIVSAIHDSANPKKSAQALKRELYV